MAEQAGTVVPVINPHCATHLLSISDPATCSQTDSGVELRRCRDHGHLCSTKKPGAEAPSTVCDECSTPGRIRTCDFLLRRQALYPLSYGRSNVPNYIIAAIFVAVLELSTIVSDDAMFNVVLNNTRDLVTDCDRIVCSAVFRVNLG
jgi:hypothetical protein